MSIYERHCMFRGKRLEDGEAAYGNLEVRASVMMGPMGCWPPVSTYHLVQVWTRNGVVQSSDEMVDPDSLEMFLGELNEQGRAVYVPMGTVLERANCPGELWAVKPDPGSTDWNEEPERHIVHYTVHAYEPETGRYYVNTDGWPGLKHRHWVKGKDLYRSLEAAEAALEGGGQDE